MRRLAGGVVTLAVLTGCGPAPHTRAAGALTPLSVRPVDWNPGHAPLGHVKAVADADTVVAVFGDAGAIALSSGAVVATDPTVTDWVAASAIPGADGSARWLVGVDGKGRVHYLRGLSAFDDVSARYGLATDRVHGVATLDASHVGFLVDQGMAVADGQRVTRYATGPLLAVAGGAGKGAGIGTDAVLAFDARSPTSRTFELPGATRVAIGADGRLYAATARAVYGSAPDGTLTLLYDAESDRVHGLVASGSHVWFADGSELGLVDGDHVTETTGAGLAPDASLAPSSSGDVWVVAPSGVQRFARVEAQPAIDATWTRTLSPIFGRVCASCHQPGGSSGTDLSTAAAWQAEKQAIRDRVVVAKTMPPEGHPLADADREAIRAWVTVAP